MDEYANSIGFIAGVVSTAAVLPQIYRIWKTKCGKDVSRKSYYLFSLGTLVWVLYGCAAHSLPVILTNAVNLALNFWVIFLKYHYEKRSQ